MLLLDLVPGQAFELAEGPLAQRGVGAQRQGEALGQRARRVGRALQVAGIDGVDVLACQRQRDAARLFTAGAVQPDVDLALDARGHVPRGFAVAHGDDARDALVQRVTSRRFKVYVPE